MTHWHREHQLCATANRQHLRLQTINRFALKRKAAHFSDTVSDIEDFPGLLRIANLIFVFKRACLYTLSSAS
jgi:hypothetical protein